MREQIEQTAGDAPAAAYVGMEMAKIFLEVDRMGGTRAGAEGQGHLASQRAMSIAFRTAKRMFDVAAAVAVGMVRSHIVLRIQVTRFAKPTFGAVCA